ncbi:chitin synthase-domain-containing protein [Lactarius pseudohatsudake]|nr:chitin synthase-domain-containing protein [Lactarius pseudohatsudake]
MYNRPSTNTFRAPPDDGANNNIYYGRIPQRVPRCNKTPKRLELFHDNFVLDSAVPTKLLNLCTYKDERAFTQRRYSAATGDPNDFKDNGFALRQVHYESTTHRAGQNSWQEGTATNVANGNPVSAHIYEYTTQIDVTESNNIEGAEKGITPVQIIFCLRRRTRRRSTPHRWFFNAFGRILRPNVCVLLDVGTRPGLSSNYRLWKAFDINSNVGGACGEIMTFKGKYGQTLLNPLGVAAQHFEIRIQDVQHPGQVSVLVRFVGLTAYMIIRLFAGE